MSLAFSPWPWVAGSVICVVFGFVAASGWTPRRRRTSGAVLDFTRRKVGQ